MRATRNESNFETALRLTKQLKDAETYILRTRTLNGEKFLDSKTVLDVLYEGLTEEIPDPPKTFGEAIERVFGTDDGSHQSNEEFDEVLALFPNKQSVYQAFAAEGSQLRPQGVTQIEEYFNRNSR